MPAVLMKSLHVLFASDMYICVILYSDIPENTVLYFLSIRQIAQEFLPVLTVHNVATENRGF